MSPLGRDESPDQLLSGSGEVATRSLVQQKFLLLEIVADVQVAKEARGLDHNVQVELVTAHANNGLTDPSAITLREASEGEEQTYRKATSGMTVAAHVASERRRVVGATINDGGGWSRCHWLSSRPNECRPCKPLRRPRLRPES